MARKQIKPLQAKISPDSTFFETIEEAYRVFKYPKPTSIGLCENCCMEPEIEADFFNPQIDELPLHYLSDWFFAASDIPLDKNIWAYLLPRVLEVLAFGEEPALVGIEVSLSRFPTGDKENWSKDEWRVIDQFQRLFLRESMRSKQAMLDDILCMFGNAHWSIADLLEQVWSLPDEFLIPKLNHDWCLGNPCVWVTTFWDKPNIGQTFGFYTSDKMYDRLEHAAFSDQTPAKLAKQALDAAQAIEVSRPKRR